jgi:hypothetical protein
VALDAIKVIGSNQGSLIGTDSQTPDNDPLAPELRNDMTTELTISFLNSGSVVRGPPTVA